MGREFEDVRAQVPVQQVQEANRLQMESQIPLNQMPGYTGRGYIPPYDPRYPQDVPYQHRNNLPPVEIYNTEPPIQGQRGRGQVQWSQGRTDGAGGDGFPPETYMPIDPRRVNGDAYDASQAASQNDRYSPYQYQRPGNPYEYNQGRQPVPANPYEYNQGRQPVPTNPYESQGRPGYQPNPAESSYSPDAIDYMRITPEQFAYDLRDGQMDMGRKLAQRLTFMSQHGQKRDVIPFMNEINRDLRAMGSPFYLSWQLLGDQTFGSQRLSVTYHGSKGLEVGFQL